MEILLMRHGQAGFHPEDEMRSLTEKGCLEVEKIADLIGKKNCPLDEIWRSPLKRAAQTTEIMVESLSLQAKETMVYSFLKPEGDFQVAANQMEGQSKNLLVICHLPIIQEISESLLGKSFDLGGVYFEAGSCYCLKKEEGIWKVKWLFHPSELVF